MLAGTVDGYFEIATNVVAREQRDGFAIEAGATQTIGFEHAS